MAQVGVGYFEDTVREKLQSRGLRFLGYFYNLPRPPKVYIDK